MPRDYPTPEELASGDENLQELEDAKATLEKAGVPVSPELLIKIEQVSSQTRENLPKWVTEPKWIGKLKNLKSSLEGAIQQLEGEKGAKKQIASLQAQLTKVENVLSQPKEYLHGMSKGEYAQIISGAPETEATPEFVDNLIDDQHEDNLSTLKTFSLYDPEDLQEGDIAPPSLDEVKELLSQQLTPEQLEVINQMQKPILQLVPLTSSDQYLKALNSHKPMEGQQNAYVPDWTQEALKRADKRDGTQNNKIIGWKVAITEGIDAPKVLKGDDINKTSEQRLQWFESKYGKKGVSGMDFKRYKLLQMRGLAKESPRPLDNWQVGNTWTLLNDEPVQDNYVAGGDWSDASRQFNLRERHTDRQFDYARFRASVVVDVPKS